MALFNSKDKNDQSRIYTKDEIAYTEVFHRY
jgi:hypothetical protein